MAQSNFNMVAEFHEKFGLKGPHNPILLDTDEQKFRLVCLHEELNEYEEAVQDENAEEQLDALVDLIYFAYGTAHRNGFDIDEAFKRVHFANMQKVVDPNKQRRGWHMEINKPEGWESPVLTDLVMPDTTKFLLAGEYNKLKGLIILDGPDATGKTTLANRIAEITGGEHIHLTWTPNIEAQMKQYRGGALTYASVLAEDQVVIVDRAWLSHPIYSEMYRAGVVAMDEEGFELWPNWRDFCEEQQAMSVIALPSVKEDWLKLYHQMTETREELYAGESIDKMGRIYDAFDDYSRGLTGCYGTPNTKNLVTYDMSVNSNGQLLDTWILNNVINKLGEK